MHAIPALKGSHVLRRGLAADGPEQGEPNVCIGQLVVWKRLGARLGGPLCGSVGWACAGGRTPRPGKRNRPDCLLFVSPGNRRVLLMGGDGIEPPTSCL